jgi:hypothetical protein
MRARDRLAQRLADLPRRMAEEDRQKQDQVLAEFGGDPRAMADESLRLRHGLARLAEAISLMQQGAPFAMIRPGPYGKPKAEQADGYGH